MTSRPLTMVTHWVWDGLSRGFHSPRILRVYWPEGDNMLYSVDPVQPCDWIFRGISTEEDPRGLMNSYEVLVVSQIPDMRTLGVQYVVRLNKARKPDSFEAA
jgi:hypothetical protein